MIYAVEFTLQAEEDFTRLDRTVAQHIVDKIEWLSQNIEGIVPAPLKGNFKGKYKLRVRDWRVIYSLDHLSQVVTVYAVRHRSDVYKV